MALSLVIADQARSMPRLIDVNKERAMESFQSRRGNFAAYSEPFFWWGPVWTPPAPRSVIDLIQARVMPARTAALLWALLTRRASIAVVAGPSGAGKTTVLTALLDFLPLESQRCYLRGCYESFAFLDDSAIDPARGALLVNELSPHFPAYLWGPGVHRLFESGRRGFQIALTAHAATVTAFVALLTGYPLRVPMRDVGQIPVVLTLEPPATPSTSPPRLSGLWVVAPGGGASLNIDSLLDVGPASVAVPALAAAASLITRLDENERRRTNQTLDVGGESFAQELASRTATLDQLAGGHAPTPETVAREITAREARWRAERAVPRS